MSCASDSKRETLVVAVDYDPSVYYVDENGEPMGIGYAIIKAISDSLSLPLELVVVPSCADAIERYRTTADIYCSTVANSSISAKNRSATIPIRMSRLLLVQMSQGFDSDSAKFVESIYQLEGKTLYLPQYMRANPFLDNLREETGVNFEVAHRGSSDELVQALIESNEVDYIVLDEAAAQYHAAQHPSLNIDMSLTFDYPISLYVNSSDLARINSLIVSLQQSGLGKWRSY